jgi:hypothetical protein
MQTQIATTVITALLLFVTSTPKAMAADECSTDQSQPVLAQNGSSISGHGTLVVNNEGADAVIRAENLTPGVAYTAWFVYFDDTAQCIVRNACAPADLIMPPNNPPGVFGRMDSGVAGANGQLTFRGALRDFRVSAGSAVHVVLFAHGPANATDNRVRAQQLLTPQAPALGAPGLGVGAQAGFLVAFAKFDIVSCK